MSVINKAPAAIVKAAPSREGLLAWLLDPAHYAQSLMRPNGAPLRLDAWQAEYLRDGGKFINILKSRRVGGSWAMTLKMFIRAQVQRGYSGTFISLNLEEAVQKIDYALKMHESLPPRFRKKLAVASRTELVFIDGLGNRSSLKSIASRAPRGKGGDIGISELPHCRDQAKIYEGALHVTSRSPQHQLTVESTPIGKTGVFYDICRGRYAGFKRYEIPWWLCSALCTDVERARREAPALSTPQRVESFGTPSMRAIFAAMPEEAFRQESELAFIEAEECAFPLPLLQECATAEYGPFAGAALAYQELAKTPGEDDWRWLETNRKGTLHAGYDVGRTHDDSALFILDRVAGRLEARMAVRLSNIDFSAQEKILARAIKAGVRTLGIDATGIGMPLAERMEQAFGAAASAVHFTAPVKTRLVTDARVLLMDKKLRLPLDRGLIGQLRSIERSVTDSGNIVYHAPRAGGCHADLAWAFMLACGAAKETAFTGIQYEPVTLNRNPRRWEGI